jgi:O-antigen ligase
VTALLDRTGSLLGSSRSTTLLRLLLILEAFAVVIAVFTAAQRLDLGLAAAIGGLGLLISIRWPLVSLFAFAALIPVEEVVQVQGLGTLSRVAAILFALTYAVPRLGVIRIRAMPLPGWAWIGWALLSAGWALDRSVAIAALGPVDQLFGVAVLIADAVASRPGIVRPLLWTYSTLAAVTASIGIVAYVSGSFDGERIAAFADQDVAQFAAILLPAFVFSMFQVLHGRLILFSAPLAFLNLAGILLSGTRGAWLGIGVVVAFLVLPRLKPRRRVAAVGTLALGLLLALQLPGAADLIANRTALAVPTGGAGRTEIWAVGIAIFESEPVIGVGYGNYIVAYTPERIRDSAVGETANEPDARAGSHSIVFGTLAELGIPGTLILLLFLGPLVARRGGGEDAAAVQAMLVALMTSALFLDVLNRKQVWLVIGLAAGLTWLERTRSVADPAGPPRGLRAASGAAPDRGPAVRRASVGSVGAAAIGRGPASPARSAGEPA